MDHFWKEASLEGWELARKCRALCHVLISSSPQSLKADVVIPFVTDEENKAQGSEATATVTELSHRCRILSPVQWARC